MSPADIHEFRDIMLKNGDNYNNAELYRKSDQPPIDREITVEQEIGVTKSNQ